MRWGILANLALILVVSGILLFLVFSASLERAAIEVTTKQAIALADLTISRISNADSVDQVWTSVRMICRGESGSKIDLYGPDGRRLGGCGPDTDLGPPDQIKSGRRIRVQGERWPFRLFQPKLVVLDVTGEFRHKVRSVRTFLEIPPSVYEPAWKFFGGYLILTQVSLFFLGYILFHRTVIGPVQEVAGLAGKASGLTKSKEFSFALGGKGDIQKISLGLRAMIEKIVDDRKKMETLVQELRTANRDLEAAQQGLIRSEKLAGVGRLAAGLAHEIGNPLQIVMGYLEFLQKNSDSEATDDILPRMDQELRRIHDILERLLEFAKPIKENVVACDLNELVRDMALLIDGRKGFRKVALNYLPDPDIPLIDTEPEKIRQVMVNLIFNAVDAIPDSGGTVSLRTRKCIDFIEIEVEDNGSGIPEERMGQIFDPFFTTKEPGKGTGLGLSVCLGLIESMGASINIRSTEGKGTVVVVRLPIT